MKRHRPAAIIAAAFLAGAAIAEIGVRVSTAEAADRSHGHARETQAAMEAVRAGESCTRPRACPWSDAAVTAPPRESANL